MGESIDRSMTEHERTEFLGSGGVGVIALAADDQPYAVPVSFGFEPNGSHFYIRLASREDSERSPLLNESRPARLVVYDGTNGHWTSVIATGTLETVDANGIDTTVVEGLKHAQLPVFERLDGEPSVEFELFVLEPETVVGRTTRPPQTD